MKMPAIAPMRCPTGPQPLHHVTVQMPVEGMEGWTARVLCLQHPDGEVEVFRPLLKYFRAHPTRSSSWQDTAAQALGLLWDYSVATRQTRPDRKPRDLFRDFAFALVKGTVSTEGVDPSGLYWPSTPYARCKGLINLGVKVSHQPMHAETDENEERREIRQQKKSVEPYIDLLAGSDRQAVDDVRSYSGRVVGGRPWHVPWRCFRANHFINLPLVFLTVAHNFMIHCSAEL
jgi:hypothetical protein